MLSSMTNLFTRVIIAYLLAHFIGSIAIWWSIPIGWRGGAIVTFIRIKSGKWKVKKVVSIQE